MSIACVGAEGVTSEPVSDVISDAISDSGKDEREDGYDGCGRDRTTVDAARLFA